MSSLAWPFLACLLGGVEYAARLAAGVHRCTDYMSWQFVGSCVLAALDAADTAYPSSKARQFELGPDGKCEPAMRCGIEADGFHCAAGWAGTLGVNWQRAKCLDEHGRALQQDVYGSPLTFSGGDSDTMALALLRAVYSCALLSI